MLNHACAFGAEVHIVTSLTGEEGKAGDEMQIKLIQNTGKALKTAINQCRKQNLRCGTHLLVRGFEAGEDRVKYAEENSVDQIVIGGRKRSKVGKMLRLRTDSGVEGTLSIEWFNQLS